MKICDILVQGRPTLSFEVFPPKVEDVYDVMERAAAKVAMLEPDSMSVTYGADGGASDYMVGIASGVQKSGVTPLTHLTCVSFTRDKVCSVLEELKGHGIENVLVLRGGILADSQTPQGYHCALELIHRIKWSGGFCIGAVYHPEDHVKSTNKSTDMDYPKKKVEAGRDLMTTQMLLDNSIPYSHLRHVREKGITVLVTAGIMPMINTRQIKRITQISGTYLPSRFLATVDKFGDSPAAMKQVGIACATDQIIDLIASGVRETHVYPMDKPDAAMKIRENLSEILQRQGVLVGGKDKYKRY